MVRSCKIITKRLTAVLSNKNRTCIAHPHHHRLWNVVPGADIAIGFGGAWLLILIGKVIMNKLLRRPENYYAEQAAGNAEAKAAASSPAAKRRGKTLKQKAGGRHE